MSRRTREARMAAQAVERVPVLERHDAMPAKVEAIACIGNLHAMVRRVGP